MFYVEDDFWPLNTVLYVKNFHGNDPRFVYYLLESFDLKRFESGAGVPTLNRNFVHHEPVLVPPLAEQHRIVGLLDEAFDGLTTARADAEQNLANARALFESHLNTVFTEGSEGWAGSAALGDLLEIGSSKRVLKAQWKKEGVPFYRGREITKLSVDGFVDNDLFISEEDYEDYAASHGVPKAGDIMLTAIGTIGNSYIVKESDRFYFKDASVLWLRRSDSVKSDFIDLWLESPQFRNQLDRGNGATVDTLTITKLRSVLIDFPSLHEQKQIVADLDALRKETQRLEALYRQKLDALDELKQSLLHQAFSGQL